MYNLSFIVSTMTFKPSDGVFDQELEVNQNVEGIENNSQNNGESFFHISEDMYVDKGNSQAVLIDEIGKKLNSEEIRSKDLSELLKESEEVQNQKIEADSDHGQKIDNSQSLFINEKKNDYEGAATKNSGNYAEDTDKLWDENRIDMVSQIEGAEHSDLDLLVNEQWINVINKYKKLHRFVFNWGVYSLAVIVGLIIGIYIPANANNIKNYEIIKDTSIEKSISDKWGETLADSVLGNLADERANIDIMLAYGSAKVSGNMLQSKSNLISYDGIILPQVASINYKTQKFFLDNFYNQNMTRDDLRGILNTLVTNVGIYSKVNDLKSVEDIKTNGQKMEIGLLEGFSLGCLDTNKLSDFFCDEFVNRFGKYGKYYNLYEHSSDLLSIVKKMKKQGKNTDIVCKMVNEYTQHSLIGGSDNLNLVMDGCKDEDKLLYKKMINFIEIEKALSLPELSDKVYEDPDLNAYKLLSAQQNVYKILNGGSSINKRYISSYLNFVQSLINKDKGKSTYIAPIYKDMTYIFNMDEINDKLLERRELSNDLKTQIDHINNGNSLYGYTSLINLITTKSIIQANSEFSGYNVQIFTAEDLFSQYYSMEDRLKIRNMKPISDDEIRVQTEIFSEKVYGVTGGVPIRATLVLYRKDNVLNVKSINIPKQLELSDVLNIRATEEISFYAMLNYIDDQIGFWYNDGSSNNLSGTDLCGELYKNKNIILHVCNENNIEVGKDGREYKFDINNGVLNSFHISDSYIESVIMDRVNGVMFSKDNTYDVINSILNYYEEENDVDDNLDRKLQVIDQFRIHLKLIPEVYDISGMENEFVVDFTLGDIDLQANYSLDTRKLTAISYKACDKVLEIEGLTIDISSNNTDQLIELLNNPRVFLVKANQGAYRNYLTMCEK